MNACANVAEVKPWMVVCDPAQETLSLVGSSSISAEWTVPLQSPQWTIEAFLQSEREQASLRSSNPTIHQIDTSGNASRPKGT